jgi:hypothetical protein
LSALPTVQTVDYVIIPEIINDPVKIKTYICKFDANYNEFKAFETVRENALFTKYNEF